ncbi:hypothetical protein GCM10009860_10810 [Microbacterium mitrae]
MITVVRSRIANPITRAPRAPSVSKNPVRSGFAMLHIRVGATGVRGFGVREAMAVGSIASGSGVVDSDMSGLSR